MRPIAETLRVEHWLKNGFVFAGLLFSGRFTDPASVGAATIAFVCFALVSSAVYVQNDLLDRDADRAHPKKRRRPIASGALSERGARLLQGVLLVAGLGVGAWFDRDLGVLLGAYLLLNWAYSRWLKHVVILDVMTIAIGFVLRVIAGCVVIDVAPSQWIVLCAFMLAMHLGFGKRRQELLEVGDRPTDARPVLASYGVRFLDLTMTIVSTLTIVCYVLFTMWPDTVARQGTTRLVYTTPFVIYGLLRYDWLVHRRDAGDPTAALLTDPHLVVTAILWALTSAALLGAGWRGEPMHW
jgi:4-hydroxybenzoate polyprenyltransferase